MENSFNNTNETESNCCRNTCANVIKNGEAVSENHYRCDQQPLTAAELWRIQRNRKPASIRNNFL
ncbi:MAG TPA: hypothetical protein VF145_06210 [Chitinophagaceae bacterium]